MTLPLLLLASLAARADAPLQGPAATLGPNGYALVIGSNRPGPGQTPLRYAIADALRVEAVFTELGGLDPDHVVFLSDPSPDRVLEALDELKARISLHASADERSALLFYYSGHARAQGLDLGGEALPIEALRAHLDALPATMRLVVLDACQAGVMSEIKGVEPAASFSSVSVAGLDAEGLAVIASSTATELSQESETLQGSYFTHHLVVGRRGAADRDDDGVVTLDEAYRYAYDRTLVATAATAVGGQHPTLETELKGTGGVALTHPGVGTARLVFGPTQQGEVLLVHRASGTVAAEVEKVQGDALRIALPAGDYDVLWRQESLSWRCDLQLPEGRESSFAPVDCGQVVAAASAAKGEVAAAPARPEPYETLAFELGIGGSTVSEDAYTARLSDFGFEESLRLSSLGQIQFLWTPQRHLSLLASTTGLERRSYQREVSGAESSHETRFSWGGARYGVGVRGQLPIAHGWLVPYAQAGGGLGHARTLFDDAENGETVEHFWGWQVNGGIGLQLVPSFGARRWRHLGLYLQHELVSAPLIENLLEEGHDSGGQVTTFGFRTSF